MTWVYRPGHPQANENGMVDKRMAGPLTRSQDPRVYVISDTMAPARHMGTGRMHDSKAAFRADTRAAGCVEVGTDRAILRERPRPEPSMRDIAMDVKKSLEQLRSR
jgi:hypothetical protein